jgi:hypothetical protein
MKPQGKTPGPNPVLDHLLRDTFSIGLSERDKVQQVKMFFDRIAHRLDGVNIILRAKTPHGLSSVDTLAYANEDGGAPGDNTIYAVPKFFTLNGKKERASVMIHESVHLINGFLGYGPDAGHPGGTIPLTSDFDFDSSGDLWKGTMGNPKPVLKRQFPLKITDFHDAVRNPYCYQYFALWLH